MMCMCEWECVCMCVCMYVCDGGEEDDGVIMEKREK